MRCSLLCSLHAELPYLISALPTIVFGKLGSNKPSSQGKHKPATAKKVSFGVRNRDNLLKRLRTARRTTPTTREQTWNTEADIKQLCFQLLWDVKNVFDGPTYLTQELTLTCFRPDIVLVLRPNGIPVGFIEVKKPNHQGPTNLDAMSGQVCAPCS
jgi:hypothetical protein